METDRTHFCLLILIKKNYYIYCDIHLIPAQNIGNWHLGRSIVIIVQMSDKISYPDGEKTHFTIVILT